MYHVSEARNNLTIAYQSLPCFDRHLKSGRVPVEGSELTSQFLRYELYLTTGLFVPSLSIKLSSRLP
jgi:hypothetical protein